MDKMPTKEYLCKILRPQDKVILCAPSEQLGQLRAAIGELGAVAVDSGADRRWQSLMRQALLNRVTVAVGCWRLILGLTKLAKATAAPLRIGTVALVGEACPDWAMTAIQSGLDAKVRDCTGTDTLEQPRDFAEQLDPALLRWASVLDYRAEKTEMGLSLELVVFPGKQLPQLPSGGKVIVRPWDPGTDVPFCHPL